MALQTREQQQLFVPYTCESLVLYQARCTIVHVRKLYRWNMKLIIVHLRMIHVLRILKRVLWEILRMNCASSTMNLVVGKHFAKHQKNSINSEFLFKVNRIATKLDIIIDIIRHN